MAQLRLSGSDVIAALRGLSEQERDELLTLLRQADDERAEAPEDTRQSLDELIERDRQKSAAASSDPARWLAMDEAHAESRSAHYCRLLAGQDMRVDIEAYMTTATQAWHEAGEKAAVDRCPAPKASLEAEPEPDVDEAAIQSLPPATRRDIEYSRARREDARIAQLLAKAGVRDE
jgi:hypothetical protein